MPSPLFTGRDRALNDAARAKGRYESTRCWCQYPIITRDPLVRYQKIYSSPGRGFAKESCFTLSDGLRVDILRPQPPHPHRVDGRPELHLSTSAAQPYQQQQGEDQALSPHSVLYRKQSLLTGHLKDAVDKVRGRNESIEQVSPLTAKERRYKQSRAYNMVADLPGQHPDNHLGDYLLESKAQHALSNPMPNARARQSSADVLTQNRLESAAENISPTAAETASREAIAHRRQGFSFHSEEQALAHQKSMNSLHQPYLQIDGASSDVLGRELSIPEIASMENGERSHFSRTSSTATRNRRSPGRDGERERQDSKVAAAARKFSVAMRKMSEYMRPAGLRRETVT